LEALTDQLDKLIERRGRDNPERPEEASYAESVRRYHARQRKEVRAQWYAYFCRLADSLRSRAEEYDRRAEALMEDTNRGEGGR
jgi:hypothetical protein